MSKILSFLADLFSDGYRIVGILAPLLSLAFTLFKTIGPADFDLHDVSYAWALAPLVGWFVIAYVRRWSHSRTELQCAQDEITTLRGSMDKRAALNAARHRISVLRSDGVAIRNNGIEMPLTITPEGLEAWCVKAENWNEEVKKALADIDPAISEWFATLDAVPQPRVRPDNWVNGRHAKMFREHDFRLHRLDALISDNWLGRQA